MTPERLKEIKNKPFVDWDIPDLIAAYEDLAKELAEAMKANARLNDEIVWLQGRCQNEAQWMDRAKELEAALAKAREALRWFLEDERLVVSRRRQSNCR